MHWNVKIEDLSIFSSDNAKVKDTRKAIRLRRESELERTLSKALDSGGITQASLQLTRRVIPKIDRLLVESELVHRSLRILDARLTFANGVDPESNTGFSGAPLRLYRG